MIGSSKFEDYVQIILKNAANRFPTSAILTSSFQAEYKRKQGRMSGHGNFTSWLFSQIDVSIETSMSNTQKAGTVVLRCLPIGQHRCCSSSTKWSSSIAFSESHLYCQISAIQREPRPTRHTVESEQPTSPTDGVIQAVETELVENRQMHVQWVS